MDVTSPPDGNNTMVPPSVLLQDVVTAVPTSSLDEETLRRQKELEEFYSTYDVWTGIRTAITLALFFIFTVTLILYKSKCKPRRKYELYPSLEDMPGRPLDYCDYWCASPVSNETGRKSTVDSLGHYYGQGRGGETGSAPLPTKRSVGSYSSLNNSFRVKSLPGSVMRINCSRMSSFERDDVSQATAHSCRSEFLRVPGVRLQSTGSSSDGYSAGSSTHDLPSDINSVGLLGVPGLGPRGNKPLLQLGGMDWDSDHATAEWVQTIDINVIQPTPNISPCGSVRSVSDNSDLARLPLPGRGRVTSVLSIDSPDYDSRSIGSDSVFLEDSVGETGSSFSESMDSGTAPSLLATPQSTLSPSPRFARRKVQSFRLGINPAHRPASPSLSAPVRMQTLSNLHRPTELRGRKKPLQRQKVQDLTSSGVPMMGTLLVPSLASNLTASCERLAAHSAVTSEVSLNSSRGSASLAPTSSVEDEPMCAVFTVPALRRTNSATTPEMREEAAESASFKRADSEQNPAVRRSDSATDPQRQSSESSSGSEASDSVSFHLMVPELSVDIPSADTSRASTPTLSPLGSPIASPSPRPPRLSTSRSRSLEPVPSIKRKGSKRGAGGSSKGSGRNGKRVLKRQHNVQCAPVSPTFRHEPLINQTSLPTYMEEDDDDLDDVPLPPAPPSSPYPPSTDSARQSLQREDSSPPSPTTNNNVMETSC